MWFEDEREGNAAELVLIKDFVKGKRHENKQGK